MASYSIGSDYPLDGCASAEFGGTVVDPYGQTKAGFTVDAKISRKKFGLRWSAVTEAGSVVVGGEIKIHSGIQLVNQS